MKGKHNLNLIMEREDWEIFRDDFRGKLWEVAVKNYFDENVAYIMAYHADRSIAENIDDWLDQFERFSIYEILPEILELWGANLETEVQSKKTSKK